MLHFLGKCSRSFPYTLDPRPYTLYPTHPRINTSTTPHTQHHPPRSQCLCLPAGENCGPLGGWCADSMGGA